MLFRSTHDDGEIGTFETLDKVNRLQRALKKYPEFSKPMSVVEVVSYANQTINEGDPAFYRMPNALDLADIMGRMPTTKSSDKNQMMSGLIDSTRTGLRISYQIKDVGSVSLDSINKEVAVIIDRIFPKDEYSVQVTGTSAVFLKGNS